MRSRENIRVKRILIRNFFYDFFSSALSRLPMLSFIIQSGSFVREILKTHHDDVESFHFHRPLLYSAAAAQISPFSQFQTFPSSIYFLFFPRHHPKPSNSQCENIADDDRDKNSLPHWWLLESIKKKAKEGKFACREMASTGRPKEKFIKLNFLDTLNRCWVGEMERRHFHGWSDGDCKIFTSFTLARTHLIDLLVPPTVHTHEKVHKI